MLLLDCDTSQGVHLGLEFGFSSSLGPVIVLHPFINVHLVDKELVTIKVKYSRTSTARTHLEP